MNGHFNKLQALLDQAYHKRKPLLKDTNAFRIANGRGDHLDGLVIEQYNRHFVIQLYKEYWYHRFPIIHDWLDSRLQPAYVIAKNRIFKDGRSLDNSQTQVLVDKAESKTIVTEYDIKFSVDLNDSVNSGLFLDMRRNRKVVGGICANKNVLNTFAYTCSFGVYARKNGCEAVNNVDISLKNLKHGEENYKLNDFEVRSEEFIRQDCEKYIKRAIKHKNGYDLIIIDPPSFSRFERKVFQIKRDLPKLLGLSLKLLKPQGVLFVSTNYSGITAENLMKLIKKLSSTRRKSLRDVSVLSQDIDFPGTGAIRESHLAAVLIKFR